MSSSSSAPVAVAPSSSGGGNCCESLKSADVNTVRLILKVANVINAMLLAATGIVTFLTQSLDLLVVLSAIYVLAFSLALLFFELRLKICDSMIYRNFGFMFRWKGRCLFFVFIGTLTFGLGTMGIIAGIVTFVNMFFNAFIMLYHPKMSEVETQEDSKRLENITIDPKKTFEMVHAAAPVITAAAGVANSMNAKGTEGDWEKLYDSNTQQYYYHNHATGETRWEAP